MPYSKFYISWVEKTWEMPGVTLQSTNGPRLYETDDGALLHKMIYLNNLPRLKEYISVYFPPLLNRDHGKHRRQLQCKKLVMCRKWE